MLRDIIGLYFENHIKTINTVFSQSVTFLNVKYGGTYIYQCRRIVNTIRCYRYKRFLVL
jgi:hypothetical protein